MASRPRRPQRFERLTRVLELRFSTRAGRIELVCDPAHGPDLQVLRTRFASGIATDGQTIEVGIDDFLINLVELATWPEAENEVRWMPELLALVEENAADAAKVRAHLAGESTEIAPPIGFQPGKDWAASLTDFQQRDLGKLLELEHGANFSVPGAGKTRVTLAVFHARRLAGQVRRMLVICPKSAFESWRDEVDICYPSGGVRVGVLDGPAVPPCDILLCNYDRLPSSYPALLRFLRSDKTLFVLDEAHRMKLGPAGAWGAVCLALGPYGTKRLILTGTPAPNGPRDLENLFAFVWPGQGRTRVSSALGSHDLRTASSLLRPLFVRTTKGELNLPPMYVTTRRVDLPALHRELYDALLGHFSERWRAGQPDAEALGRIVLYLIMAATTPALLAAGASRYEPLPYRLPPLRAPSDTTLTDLMRDLPHYELSPKYQEALALVAANAAMGRKTIVWSTFVRNLTSLEHLFRSYSPAVVHGGTADRTDQLRRFRTDPSCMVLLTNPATLGEGVSLHQVCHDAIYIDRDFAAGRFLQSLDRIHRLGLAPDVDTRVTVLVSNDTIDELVEVRLSAKLDFMGRVLDDPAVLQLGDLDEEPSETAGMDTADIAGLLQYLGGSAPS